MSGAFAETLHCRVRVSGYLLAFNRVVHASAFAVMLALAWYRPYLLIALPVLGLSCWRAERAIRLRRPDSVLRLRWAEGNHWMWQQNNERIVRGQLLDATVIGPHVVILRLRAAHRRFGTAAVLLAADSLAPDVHRRLRACLTLWQPEDVALDFISRLQQRLSSLRAVVQRRR